jgi:hypothetical protein
MDVPITAEDRLASDSAPTNTYYCIKQHLADSAPLEISYENVYASSGFIFVRYICM